MKRLVRRSRRGRLISFLPLGAALAALSLLGTGCDVSPPAATVNGTTITQSQLNSQLSLVVDNAYARCVIELQGNVPSSLEGVGGSTVSSQFASYQLSTMVLDRLVSQDLARRRVTVGSDDLASARVDLASQLQPSSSSGGTSPCGLAGSQLLQHVPSSFASRQIEYLADEEQLAAALGHLDLSGTGLLSYYSSHASQFAQVCLADIAVTSQSQAESIRNAVVSGSVPFATEARQNSIDVQTAQNGGGIPCVLSSQIQNAQILSAIASLGPGQVSQPISEAQQTGGTVWLLIEVTGTPELPFTEAVSQIRQTLLSSQDSKVSSEFDKITADAHVTVDPRYGTWSHLRGVSPPVPPASKYVLSPSADLPATLSG